MPKKNQPSTKLTESVTDHILTRMAILAEQHVGSKLAHIRRISLVTYQIATHLGIPQNTARIMATAARIHDIGMICVPDSILKKAGKLTEAEHQIIRDHVTHGLRLLGRKNDVLIQMARSIIATHHERHDGSGYPNQLQGDAIPVEGRIAALADTFDALCSSRPYRRANDPATVISLIINGGAGMHFNPAIVDAFASCRKEIMAICQRHPHR